MLSDLARQYALRNPQFFADLDLKELQELRELNQEGFELSRIITSFGHGRSSLQYHEEYANNLPQKIPRILVACVL